jgi:hypothetical protein
LVSGLDGGRLSDMFDAADFGPDGYPAGFSPFERPGLRWPRPFPDGEAWLGTAIVQLDRELDAVAALTSLRSDPRVALDECTSGRLLVSGIDHLNRGAPTIDWRIMSDLVEGFEGELRSRSPVKGDVSEPVEQLGLTKDLIARVIAAEPG